MYERLWDFIEKRSDKGTAMGRYLAINILGWTMAAALIGIVGALFMRMDFVQVLSNIICVAAYAGIIFGLIGGILFLQRHTDGPNQDGRY